MIDYIIILCTLGSLMLISINLINDGLDRQQFCNSILPIDTFENYQKNKLENEYCYKHVESYNYEDRYFDIPPREYK
jgi:hypothetical protein